MAVEYEQEQAELKQARALITERIDEMDMREQCIREFMDKAKEYFKMPKLTRAAASACENDTRV